MSVPRVFISSTFYDLQHVRNDIRAFLQNLGYEAVMHDKGNIPYTQDVSVEESCYKEVDSCDIVVCIIGGKFGTKSSNGNYSITMKELQKALYRRKKIYIYVQKDVYSENNIYTVNKTKEFTSYYADNLAIHEFIAELKDSVKDNPITPFESAADIIEHLKQQLAGLFQYLLAQESIITEGKTLEDLQTAAQAIRKLSSELTDEGTAFLKRFSSTIFSISPTLKRLLYVLNVTQYELVAPNKDAIVQYLKDIGYSISYENDADLPFDRYIKGIKEVDGYKNTIKLNTIIFDENDGLKDIRNISLLEAYIFSEKELVEEDYLPF